MRRFVGNIFLLLFLGMWLLMACSANPPHQESLMLHALTPEMEERGLSPESALAEAESLYAAGSRASNLSDWTSAQLFFSETLQIISTLDLDEEEFPVLSDHYDKLLLSLSEEYPQVLSHFEELPMEGSLALLLMRLGEIRGDSLDQIAQDSTMVSGDDVTYDVTIHWNAQVEKKMSFFQNESRNVFSTWLNRSGLYLDMMQRILREYGLPEDLVYIALIESGFNPNAYSWAHASGPWQFISSTGKLYGLKKDWWLDERRDPVKSTHAAAKYLKNLYAEFGDWPLAMAGYNCGEARVRKEIRKAGTRNFWSLKLPRQTRNYVPLFMAATVIAKSPEKYGFFVQYEEPEQYDLVKIDECTDLKVAARCCGSTYDKIKALNPELRRWCTPPNCSSYMLKIPRGTQAKFKRSYVLVPASEKVTWERHRIRRGETLSGIAYRYGTSVSAIKEANSLRSSHRIVAGKYLLIPSSPFGNSAWSSSLPASEGDSSGRELIYTVKKGDTLGRIAASFGVSLSRILRWNDLRSGKYIYPGDKLTVYLSTDVGSTKGSPEDYTELVYTVKRGDTLWGIANDFGVNLSQLVRENQLKDPSCIRPGNKLKIKMSRKL
ncbi:LysM peptidoglycan-binding domain-containing protein [bacterium]|nr:LysM peptidoglycan-binding domain-containing protein [bacterium]